MTVDFDDELQRRIDESALRAIAKHIEKSHEPHAHPDYEGRLKALEGRPGPGPGPDPGPDPDPDPGPDPNPDPDPDPEPPPPVGSNILGVDLATLPRSGAAYERVKALAARSAALDWNDEAAPGTNVLMAKGIMGDEPGVVAMVRAALDRGVRGHANAFGRNVIPACFALSFVGNHSLDERLVAFLSGNHFDDHNPLTFPGAGGRANNHGWCAELAALAICALAGLKDTAVERVLPTWRARKIGAQVAFRWGNGFATWQPDPSKPVVIVGPGKTVKGLDASGFLPEELRRGSGSYDYVLATAGMVLIGDLVWWAAFGINEFSTGDHASRRVFEALERLAQPGGYGRQPTGDDRWLGDVALAVLGRKYLQTQAELGAGDGKYMTCTDLLFGPRS